MTRTKAEFRALRETIGISKRQFSRLMKVHELSVIRWEGDSHPQQAPLAAWQLLDDLKCRQDEEIVRFLSAHEHDEVIDLVYWLTHDAYADAHIQGKASPERTWTEQNAMTRRLALEFNRLGIAIRWHVGPWSSDEQSLPSVEAASEEQRA